MATIEVVPVTTEATMPDIVVQAEPTIEQDEVVSGRSAFVRSCEGVTTANFGLAGQAFAFESKHGMHAFFPMAVSRCSFVCTPPRVAGGPGNGTT